MNAAIRAVTRIAFSRGLEVVGFERGWEGLIKNMVRPLSPRSVGGIINLGGTILLTSRCLDFKKKEGVRKAAVTLTRNRVDGLVVIGGNGSFAGSCELARESDVRIVGVPATIDNDVFGTEETIGFDTAANTAIQAIDKIRDTAISHERVFIVEVMGRTRGFLAVAVGLTIGAEVILVPEVPYSKDKIVEALEENAAKGKKSSIIVAAEGVGDTRKLAEELEEETGSEVRLSILGYAQRGGSPTMRSRLLASTLSNKTIDTLLNEKENCIVGLQNGKIVATELEKSCTTKKKLDPSLLKLAQLLAT